jgi:hypothetical protein
MLTSSERRVAGRGRDGGYPYPLDGAEWRTGLAHGVEPGLAKRCGADGGYLRHTNSGGPVLSFSCGRCRRWEYPSAVLGFSRSPRPQPAQLQRSPPLAGKLSVPTCSLSPPTCSPVEWGREVVRGCFPEPSTVPDLCCRAIQACPASRAPALRDAALHGKRNSEDFGYRPLPALCANSSACFLASSASSRAFFEQVRGGAGCVVVESLSASKRDWDRKESVV